MSAHDCFHISSFHDFFDLFSFSGLVFLFLYFFCTLVCSLIFNEYSKNEKEEEESL
jgi:ABC-type uncharacterized transport system permease subunit